MTDKYSDDDKQPKGGKPNDLSRRKFIKNTGMVAGGVVGGSLLGGLLTNQFATKEESDTQSSNENETNFQEARQFFTRMEDFAVLQAATERIFPKDEIGPGANELGVPYFIDKQLAGRWGINGRDYRLAPFMPQVRYDDGTNMELGAEQSNLDRGSIFLQGLRKMNQESKTRFDMSFDKADEEQQIEIMQDFDDGKVKMNSVSSEDFFYILRQSTLEGAYSDPLYGGNRNMEGWKMKEFPGAQASYTNVIDDDEFVNMEPISLTDYQGH